MQHQRVQDNRVAAGRQRRVWRRVLARVRAHPHHHGGRGELALRNRLPVEAVAVRQLASIFLL